MENNPQQVQESVSEVAQAAAETVLPEVAPQPDAGKPFKTTGQKIHKWGTYLGVDWIINTMMGVGFAYWGKITPLGKKIWSGPWEKVFDKALGFIKDDKSRRYGVEKGNMFVSIIAGGMFTIPMLMVLENKDVKKSTVKFLDRRIYGKDKVENDPQFQEAYAALDNEPKKDFWTGMNARFAALAPLLAFSVFIPPTRDGLEKYYFGPISKASEKTATKLGFKGKKLKQMIAMHDKAGNPVTAWKFVHDNVSFDAAHALPYAGIHAFFYDLFADKKQKTKNEAPDNLAMANAESSVGSISTVKPNHAGQEALRRQEAEINSPRVGV